tara:strand:+ start:2797 stop:3837 length:1041 start_codon:yes stop_codon:yes gene_type:complete
MKLLIVAAKTGGHIYPAVSVAKELIKNNHHLILLGTGNFIEKNAYNELNSKFYSISMEGFRGSSFFKKLKVIFQTFKNIFYVMQIINKEKIDAMIGFGGFITVPAGFACFFKRVPVYTHEQNAVMGSANKLLAKIARINFLGFDGIKLKNSIASGNPIRKNYLNKKDHQGSSNDIKIYVTGGSQGAKFINEDIPKALTELPYNLKIKHQCGINNVEIVNKFYQSHRPNIEIVEFYNNPAEQISWCDFVISRGGALSLSEISSMSRGALIIPLPTSIDNHQFHNAKSIEKIGMCVIHEQKDGQEELINKLKSIIENKTYIEWKKIKNKNHQRASKIIVTNLEKDLQI